MELHLVGFLGIVHLLVLPFASSFCVWFWVSLGMNGKSWILFSSLLERVPQDFSFQTSQDLSSSRFIYLPAYVTLCLFGSSR